ncbi:hypothetical protein LR48_Vigan11g111300 [Vigna angularis]|uniref:Uncharacterized protein n=1 Tax=Phaseolus angularis TaxID=3914 RepID=A0A0L9VTK0_PHAAN|nr:hypothetical protein LR48_Vigan11g111300 [Vigna angularis]
MANDDVDFSKLFNGDDDDDDMFYIDMNTVQKVLDEDDDCDFLEKIPDDSSSKDVSPVNLELMTHFRYKMGLKCSVGVSDSVANSWLDIEPENEGPQPQACSS